MNTRLKSLAYRMLGSAADAEDVVQEAQLRLHQADPQPASSDAFLEMVTMKSFLKEFDWPVAFLL